MISVVVHFVPVLNRLVLFCATCNQKKISIFFNEHIKNNISCVLWNDIKPSGGSHVDFPPLAYTMRSELWKKKAQEIDP